MIKNCNPMISSEGSLRKNVTHKLNAIAYATRPITNRASLKAILPHLYHWPSPYLIPLKLLKDIPPSSLSPTNSPTPPQGASLHLNPTSALLPLPYSSPPSQTSYSHTSFLPSSPHTLKKGNSKHWAHSKSTSPTPTGELLRNRTWGNQASLAVGPRSFTCGHHTNFWYAFEGNETERAGRSRKPRLLKHKDALSVQGHSPSTSSTVAH